MSYVCQGEGPRTIDALLRTDFDLENVPGLWYNSEDGIKHNPPAPLIDNLEEDLPGIAWDLLPMDKYRTANWHSWTNNCDKQPFASLYTSLGCPY